MLLMCVYVSLLLPWFFCACRLVLQVASLIKRAYQWCFLIPVIHGLWVGREVVLVVVVIWLGVVDGVAPFCAKLIVPNVVHSLLLVVFDLSLSVGCVVAMGGFAAALRQKSRP